MRHMDVPSLTVWFVLPGTMTLFTDKGCGESRVVHGHRVAQHTLWSRSATPTTVYKYLSLLACIYTGKTLPSMITTY